MGGSPSLDALDFATRHLGMIEPLPALLVAVERGDTWEPPLSSLFEHAPRNIRYNRVGVAVIQVGSARVAGVALSSSHAVTSLVPRQVSTGSRVGFDGLLDDGYQRPELALTHPDGSTTRTPLGAESRFSTQLTFARQGRTQVELLATGPSGLEVIANFPVYVGISPPSSVPLVRSGSESAEAAVRTLSELLNRERRRFGLAPLTLDPLLAYAAEEHSADMAEQRFFGHESPTRGDPMRRARRAGVVLKQLGENVGRAPSARDLHQLLMGSPGHRGNILRPDFTHFGVGVVADESSGERVLLATQLFASTHPGLSEPQFKSRLLAIVNRSRLQQRVRPLEWDAELERLACADVARRSFGDPGHRRGPLKAAASQSQAVLNAVQDPEEAAKEPVLLSPSARRLGICPAAQNTEAGAAKRVVIVVSASVFPKELRPPEGDRPVPAPVRKSK